MMSSQNETRIDPLEKLLKYAGRRESADPRRAERVEQHLTRHWHQLVQNRQAAERRRRATVIGGGLAVAASLVMAVILLPRILIPSPVVAHIETIIGIVESGARGEPMTRLAAGMEFHAGSFLETADSAGVALKLLSGHSLRVAEASRVRIEADTILLDRGRLYVDSGRTGRTKPITVHSTFATVREVGTQYQVRLLPDGFEVSVREGMVNLERDNGIVTARAGETLRLNYDGDIDREEILGHGEHWQWVAQLGPALDLNDRTLAEFLEWLSRENGWRVSYATASLQPDAQSIKISGSIYGLNAEEALASVMATVGWLYTIADGVVMIGMSGVGSGQ